MYEESKVYCGTKPTFETPLKLPVLHSRTLRDKVPEVNTRTSRSVHARPFGPSCPAGGSTLAELSRRCIVTLESDVLLLDGWGSTWMCQDEIIDIAWFCRICRPASRRLASTVVMFRLVTVVLENTASIPEVAVSLVVNTTTGAFDFDDKIFASN